MLAKYSIGCALVLLPATACFTIPGDKVGDGGVAFGSNGSGSGGFPSSGSGGGSGGGSGSGGASSSGGADGSAPGVDGSFGGSSGVTGDSSTTCAAGWTRCSVTNLCIPPGTCCTTADCPVGEECLGPGSTCSGGASDGGVFQCGACTSDHECQLTCPPSSVGTNCCDTASHVCYLAAGVCPSSADGGGCVPLSCTQLGYDCGTTVDNCGNAISCGGCVPPQFCGGGGINRCGGNSGGDGGSPFGDAGHVGQCLPVTFSPASGTTFTGNGTVTLTPPLNCTTGSWLMYYTTDGTEPYCSPPSSIACTGTGYAGPISLPAGATQMTYTVWAIGAENGMTYSPARSATYIVNP